MGRSYPVRLEVQKPDQYDRWTVLFRNIFVLPHIVVLSVLVTAQWVVTVAAWINIMATGRYPQSLYEFSLGVSRWTARVAGYMFLFTDEYPPFSLDEHPKEQRGLPQPNRLARGVTSEGS